MRSIDDQRSPRTDRCGPLGPKTIPEPSLVMPNRICATCWKEWEDMEVKVINEYRLNFMDPQHREMLQKSCAEFLQIP